MCIPMRARSVLWVLMLTLPHSPTLPRHPSLRQRPPAKTSRRFWQTPLQAMLARCMRSQSSTDYLAVGSICERRCACTPLVRRSLIVTRQCARCVAYGSLRLGYFALETEFRYKRASNYAEAAQWFRKASDLGRTNSRHAVRARASWFGPMRSASEARACSVELARLLERGGNGLQADPQCRPPAPNTHSPNTLTHTHNTHTPAAQRIGRKDAHVHTAHVHVIFTPRHAMATHLRLCSAQATADCFVSHRLVQTNRTGWCRLFVIGVRSSCTSQQRRADTRLRRINSASSTAAMP